MLKRLIAVLVLAPVAIVLIALAVSNRTPTRFTIDPFNPGNPVLTMELPLFIWLFAALGVGMIIGSVATWFKQGRYRKSARENIRKVEELKEKKAAQPTSTSAALPALGN